jgi:hypothetical protein
MNFRLALLGAGLLMLLNGRCDLNQGVLRRTALDCFPLQDSMEWTYRFDNGTTSKLFVRGDSSAYNFPCMVVEEDAAEQYWIKGDGELRKFVNYAINIGGTDYPLEQRYRKNYVLPLILGSSWSEDFQDTVPVLGDSFVYVHKIRGSVTAIGPVTVPAGDFSDCYEVTLYDSTVVNDSIEMHIVDEWFAPGIGLVKRTAEGATAELEHYRFPGADSV